MKLYSTTVSATLLSLAAASPLLTPNHGHLAAHKRFQPIYRREVPQEHSHDFVLTIANEFLQKDNPNGIVDAVFGLLGNAAAASGAGKITNLDCLKQATADQVFTNAKTAKDLRGMAGGLLYQAIERNTGTVGGASVLCNETATNAEIGALTQHQDAASENAGALNKAVTLELAKQLAAIGADPNLALLSGTFAPGSTSDPTGAGNSCDDPDPKLGCIFSQNLLVLDASQDEVSSAVANVAQAFTGTGGISATDLVDLASFSVASVTGSVDLATVVNGASGATAAANGSAATPAATPAAGGSSACLATPAATPSVCSVITTTIAADAAGTAVASATVATPAAATNAASGTVNVQAFTGALGGPPPPVVSGSGDRPFSVDGDTFVGAGAAIGRSCDVQHNACASAANSGQLAGGVAQCDQQDTACRAANSLKRRQSSTFGTCTDPSIKFAVGLDGRTEGAFEPTNEADFQHGSAQKIGIIAGFICQRLADSCKAPTAVQSQCATASSAAVAATQDQTAADTFNQALGVGGGGGAAASVTTPAAVATPAVAAGSVVTTITQCS